MTGSPPARTLSMSFAAKLRLPSAVIGASDAGFTAPLGTWTQPVTRASANARASAKERIDGEAGKETKTFAVPNAPKDPRVRARPSCRSLDRLFPTLALEPKPLG